jgi:hypothetical protein
VATRELACKVEVAEDCAAACGVVTEGAEIGRFYAPMWGGLLTAEHRDRMGSAVWEYMWTIVRTTKEVERDGQCWGLVRGGAPVKIEEIAAECGWDPRTVRRHLTRLQKGGYLDLKRAPYGLIISVAQSRKWSKLKAVALPGDRPNVAYLDGPEVTGDRPKMAVLDRPEMARGRPEVADVIKKARETKKVEREESKESPPYPPSGAGREPLSVLNGKDSGQSGEATWWPELLATYPGNDAFPSAAKAKFDAILRDADPETRQAVMVHAARYAEKVRVERVPRKNVQYLSTWIDGRAWEVGESPATIPGVHGSGEDLFNGASSPWADARNTGRVDSKGRVDTFGARTARPAGYYDHLVRRDALDDDPATRKEPTPVPVAAPVVAPEDIDWTVDVDKTETAILCAQEAPEYSSEITAPPPIADVGREVEPGREEGSGIEKRSVPIDWTRGARGSRADTMNAVHTKAESLGLRDPSVGSVTAQEPGADSGSSPAGNGETEEPGHEDLVPTERVEPWPVPVFHRGAVPIGDVLGRMDRAASIDRYEERGYGRRILEEGRLSEEDARWRVKDEVRSVLEGEARLA